MVTGAELIGPGGPEISVSLHQSHKIYTVIELTLQAEVTLVKELLIALRSRAKHFEREFARIHFIE